MNINSKSISEIIKSRTSIRTFNSDLLANEDKKKILDILKDTNLNTPFNEQEQHCRFEIVELESKSPEEKRKLGTYGFITGANQFIIGITRKSEYVKEEFGYIFEKLILEFTKQGFGTCWLGGTFNRENYAKIIDMKENEYILCISPIGIPANSRRMSDKLIRNAIKASKRKKWNTLFFEDDFSIPLTKNNAEKYAIPLEMLRLAPSAGNKQPWRILKEKNTNTFHFYWKIGKNLNYNKLHKIDMGIAVCHFDLMIQEMDLTGNWIIKQDSTFKFDQFKYVITWIGE
ncbi:nitroreductase family protein [Promethearchaeum syntrophicum]|uniref:Nitroreductase family protein n=1 Tax=Promethearchaeum syntrophicum TaxID=2594042 RepID=A0A5B9DDY6_9ARCH|nr:nitroreductase family protein [Candidatus Prometheoarchaeum syntrophicum]QEE17225.1 Nitroreductase family protein [Candidatus Prometheoarchaeum syntrophicum]